MTVSTNHEENVNELIIATERKDMQKAQGLIANGGDILLQTKNGKAIIEEIFEINSDLVITILNFNDNAKIALYYVASNGNIDLFKFIVNTRLVDLEAKDNNGFTLAQNILQKANSNLIRTIINYVTPPNDENEGSHGDHDSDILEVNKSLNSPYIKSKTTNY